MAQQVHVIDGISAGDRACHQAADRRPRVGTLISPGGGHRYLLLGQLGQPGGLRDGHHSNMDTMLQQGEVVDLTGASRKTLLGYEELGLVTPGRAENGYRLYSEHQVSVIRQIRRLNDIGIPLRDMRPFVDCLNSGSQHADARPSTLGEYRRAIERIDRTINTLTAQRTALTENLTSASHRMLEQMRSIDALNPNLAPLPEDLPEPEDDGATDHLPGTPLPAIALPSTDGGEVHLNDLGSGRVLIYVFPKTGAPEQDMPEGWDAIPGARGCSPHNCDMRNHYAELIQAGVDRVFESPRG